MDNLRQLEKNAFTKSNFIFFLHESGMLLFITTCCQFKKISQGSSCVKNKFRQEELQHCHQSLDQSSAEGTDFNRDYLVFYSTEISSHGSTLTACGQSHLIFNI